LKLAKNEKEEEAYREEILSAMNMLGTDDLQRLATETGYRELSSKLLCLNPRDCYSASYSINTPYIAEMLFLKYQSRLWEDVHRLFLAFRSIPETTTAAGWLWEGFCHRAIPDIAQLKLNHCQSNTTVTLKCVRKRFPINSLKDLDSMPKDAGYYQPAVRNKATIDAFGITDAKQIVLFQYTVSEHHAIKVVGLDKLADALPEGLLPFKGNTWYFVWVVPTQMRGSVQEQVIEDGKRKWASAREPYVRQYVLGLDLPSKSITASDNVGSFKRD